MVGDRAEVLFCPYLKWLQGAFDKYLGLSFSDWSNRAEHMATLERIKGRMKRGTQYRRATIVKMSETMVKVEFIAIKRDENAKDSDELPETIEFVDTGIEEVIPLDCVSVIERAKTHGKVHVATSQAA
jgi:hypothetical protein